MAEPKKPNAAQLASPSFRLAALDQHFLLGESTRGIRFLLEYEKPEQILKARRIKSTIVVFGGARVLESGGSERHMLWYNEARAFGRIASERGGAMCDDSGDHCNVIATGGGPGAMEAANRGARDVGAPSIGFNIRLPHEQEPNAFTTPELTFNFHYFAMRKMHLAMRANALVVFPGGFGTLDEMFEILTLRQTGKAPLIPVVLFDEAYWRSIINFEKLVEHGAIDAADLALFRFADTAEAAWEALVEQGLGKAHDDSAPDVVQKDI
ncbi:MAG: LOG family protein [Caulobacteraceae bacterium]